MNTNAISIYILDSHYLASRYIHSLLMDGEFVNVKIVEIGLLEQRQPIDLRRSLLLIDQLGISPALIPYGQKLKMCFPGSGLIAIGEHEFGNRLQRLFQSWVLGIVEYADIKTLPHAARQAMQMLAVSNGDKASSSALHTSAGPFLLEHEGISPRELEIFELLCLRLSNKEIASQLNISVATVKFHVSNIYAKLQVRRRQELLSKTDIALGLRSGSAAGPLSKSTVTPPRDAETSLVAGYVA